MIIRTGSVKARERGKMVAPRQQDWNCGRECIAVRKGRVAFIVIPGNEDRAPALRVLVEMVGMGQIFTSRMH